MFFTYTKVTIKSTVMQFTVYNKQYMIASTQITNTETFAFIHVQIFKLLTRKGLLINRKDNRNC